jgi:GNAT superfamily N-acetyltransferase
VKLAIAPRVEPLGPHHNRAAFTCGEPTLDAYVRRYASQDVRRRIAQVFVAVAGTPESISGYYSLSAASFSREDLPPEMARRLPRYPIPAAILGRLAVDRAYQGRGLGEFLLFDACERIFQANRSSIGRQLHRTRPPSAPPQANLATALYDSRATDGAESALGRRPAWPRSVQCIDNNGCTMARFRCPCTEAVVGWRRE